MITIKWILILFVLVTGTLTQGQAVTNTCSNLGSVQPTQPQMCQQTTSSGIMCCFVSVQQGKVNTNFCASVSGSNLNPQSVVDLQSDIGTNYTISVNCFSQIYSVSLVILLIVTALIFI